MFVELVIGIAGSISDVKYYHMSLFDDIQPVVDVTVDTFTTSKLRCFTKCADKDTNCMSVFYRYGANEFF